MNESLTVMTLPYPDGHDKTVRVYVPAHEEGEKLPVVYMTDGQNLFEDDLPGQFGCWYTREAVRAERGISGKAAIIVGIHNDEGAVDRTNDLTPRSIGAVRFPSDLPKELEEGFEPKGEIFDSFVVDIVMPYIEEHYPVKKGRDNTAFCGSSSGGLQAYFTALSHPDLFCISGVFSPAFVLYDSTDIISWTMNRLADPAPYLYFYCGAGDPLEQEIFESTEQVYDMLSELYPPEKLSEVLLPENPHNEKAWAPIFTDFLHTFLNREL